MDQLNMSVESPYDPLEPQNAQRIRMTALIDDHFNNDRILTEEELELLSKPIQQWTFRPRWLNSNSKFGRQQAKGGLEQLNTKRRDILRKFGKLLRPRPNISPFGQAVSNNPTLYRGKRKDFTDVEEELRSKGWVKGADIENSKRKYIFFDHGTAVTSANEDENIDMPDINSDHTNNQQLENEIITDEELDPQEKEKTSVQNKNELIPNPSFAFGYIYDVDLVTVRTVKFQGYRSSKTNQKNDTSLEKESEVVKESHAPISETDVNFVDAEIRNKNVEPGLTTLKLRPSSRKANPKTEPNNGEKLTKMAIKSSKKRKLEDNDGVQRPSCSTTLFRAERSEERVSKKNTNSKISGLFQPPKSPDAEEKASSEVISRIDDCVAVVREIKEKAEVDFLGVGIRNKNVGPESKILKLRQSICKVTASSNIAPKNEDNVINKVINSFLKRKLEEHDEGQRPRCSTTLFRAERSEERASKEIASSKISGLFQPSKNSEGEEKASSEVISRIDDCVVRIKEEEEEEVVEQLDEIIIKNEIDLD